MRILFDRQIDYTSEAVSFLEAVYKNRQKKEERDDFKAYLGNVVQTFPDAVSYGGQRLIEVYAAVQPALKIDDRDLETWFSYAYPDNLSLARLCLNIKDLAGAGDVQDAYLMTIILCAMATDMELAEPPDGSMDGFIALIEQFIQDPKARWGCIDLYRFYPKRLEELTRLTAPVEELLKEHAHSLNNVVSHYFTDDFHAGLRDKLSQTGIELDDTDTLVRPSLFAHSDINMQCNDLLHRFFNVEKLTIAYLGVLCLPLMEAIKNTEETEENLLRRLRAVNDKTRIKILIALKDGPKYTRDLIALTGLSAATVSHHINELLSSRMISLEKEGTSLLYRLSRESISRFLKQMEILLLK